MKSSTKLAFWTLLFLGVVIFVSNTLNHDKKPLVGDINLSKNWSFNYQNSELNSIVKKELENQDGDYAIYIEDLSSTKEQPVSINSTQLFPAGSLYKLFLMAAALEEEEKGNLKDDDVISSDIAHLKEVLGSQEFGYEDYDDSDQLKYSVGEILQRVATISDNYASIMLAEKISWDKVRAQAGKLGARSTIIKAPISTTADDIGLFFKKLYLKQVVSENVSDKIINLLSKSRLNDRIPEKLPEGLKIVHKTGELPRVRHDAGIVYLEDKKTEEKSQGDQETEEQKDIGTDVSEEAKAYVIVVMSKDLTGEDDGVAVLANISKVVYDYYTKGEE